MEAWRFARRHALAVVLHSYHGLRFIFPSSNAPYTGHRRRVPLPLSRLAGGRWRHRTPPGRTAVMPGSHFSARKFLCATIFLGLLLPLQVLQAAAAPSSQTASAGPVRVVAPAQPESGPPDSPSGARRGHPGPVVLHRTKLQARAAWLASGADNLTYHKGPTERPRSTSCHLLATNRQ